MLFNPQMRSAYNFVPGIMGLIFILVCAMMTSVSIVREKEVGTMEVLLVSPVRPVKIIFAKMIPYFAISCVVLIAILLLAHYLLEIPMTGGVGGIFAISILYLVLSLSLGLLVSTIATTQMAALLISAMVMMMPILMLSGMLFPIENLPKFFQVVSNIVPARWYIDAVRKMMIQGLPLVTVWKNCVILLGMTVAILGVSLKKFNDKLE
jgi:ABC-2 type transport system permease protein